MSRIAWIDVIPEEQAEGLLKELYDQERDQRARVVDNILKVHSLHPETLRAHADLYHTVMHSRGDLSLIEREMIAVVVSALNGCHY